MTRTRAELLGEPAATGAAEEEERRGFFSRLHESLGKSRCALVGEIAAAAFEPGDDEAWERLEEALIAGDVGVAGAQSRQCLICLLVEGDNRPRTGGRSFLERREGPMALDKRKIGELVALVGVVLGFIAVWTEAIEGFDVKYADDGTVVAVAVVVLGLAGLCLLASLLLGMTSLDLTAAVAGAAAFGFLLYQPAILAFEDLDMLGTGGWLGVCAGLVPLGAGAAVLWQRRSGAKVAGLTLGTVVAAIGLLLILIGIWSDISDLAPTSYWDASASGHALGWLLLLLVAASAVLIAMTAASGRADLADLALIVAGIAAGTAVAQGTHDAFNQMGDMGTGAWLQLIGGLVLLVGLIGSRALKLDNLRK